jgi:hypothetical protein
MRLRRSALSFLLLTGLCLGALSPAQAADSTPTPTLPAGAATLPGDPAAADAVPDEAAGDEAGADNLTVDASRDEATQALADVDDLFSPMTRRESRSLIASGEARDATLALRDLSLRLDSLSTSQRSSAYEEFQRPWTYGNPVTKRACQDNICVHWVMRGRGYDSVASTDSYASTVLSTMVNVSRAYRSAGYRIPRADYPSAAYGGTKATDIYLWDVGSEGKYGYCTVDVDDTGHYVYHPSNSRASDLPAFCVLDNDYSKSQFPTSHTSLQDLQVTAAHEYFHAVQFSYDYLEDRWFMEATATWAEDQLYDSINDNVQYLQRSQLRYPGLSMDKFGGAGGFLHYGDWIFFQYLTEHLTTRQGLLPVLVRRMWQYADSVTGRDLYSIQAVAAALRERHVNINRIFAQYAAANRHPATAYSEGRANRYPVAWAKKTIRLKPGKRKASSSFKVDHLASATARFVPKRLGKKRTRLTLSVNMADRKSGSQAVAVIYYKSGRTVTKVLRLSKSGNGRVRAPFSSRTVSAVDLVLVNASHSYKNCWSGTAYSCRGVPKANHVKERFSAKVS